ncbi:MAG: thioredoxin family protein [Flavobacteriaceae bacterium]|nr:thioredoxin family protein [Flavobacteriaceae bacterium]
MLEKIIAYQNKAESNFEKRKNLSTIVHYVIAFILFMVSTIIAAFTLPIRFIYKKILGKKEASVLLTLEGNDIDSLLKKEALVLIDFWAEWCGPCVMMGSIIKEFATESKGVKVLKINADLNRSIVNKYQIKGLPQFVLIKEGKEVKRFAGAMTKADLIKFCKV